MTAKPTTAVPNASPDLPSLSSPCVPRPRSVSTAVVGQALKAPPRRRSSPPLSERSSTTEGQEGRKPAPRPSPPSPEKSPLPKTPAISALNKRREPYEELPKAAGDHVQKTDSLAPSRTSPLSVKYEKPVTHEQEIVVEKVEKAIVTPPPSPSPPLSATQKVPIEPRTPIQPAAIQRESSTQTRPKPTPIITSSLKPSFPLPLSSRSTPQAAGASLSKLDSSTSSPARARRNKDGFIGVKGLAQKFNSLTPTDLAEATSVNEKVHRGPFAVLFSFYSLRYLYRSL